MFCVREKRKTGSDVVVGGQERLREGPARRDALKNENRQLTAGLVRERGKDSEEEPRPRCRNDHRRSGVGGRKHLLQQFNSAGSEPGVSAAGQSHRKPQRLAGAG